MFSGASTPRSFSTLCPCRSRGCPTRSFVLDACPWCRCSRRVRTASTSALPPADGSGSESAPAVDSRLLPVPTPPSLRPLTVSAADDAHTLTHAHSHTIADKQPTGRIRTFSTFYRAAYGGMLFLTMGKSFERRKCFIYDLGNCN